MFGCGNKPIAVAPVAPMGFGSAGSFADFDQDTMADTLKPFDLNVRHDNNTPRPELPMSDISLQDSFLNQIVADTSDPFYTNYPWNEDAVAFNSSDVTSSSVGASATSQAAQEDGDSCTVLTMYNVESRTLNSILETAFNAKTKIKMETYH